MKLIEGDFKARAAPDTAPQLRELADAIDRGEVVDVLWGYIDSQNFTLRCSASPNTGVVLAALLQDFALQRMKS